MPDLDMYSEIFRHCVSSNSLYTVCHDQMAVSMGTNKQRPRHKMSCKWYFLTAQHETHHPLGTSGDVGSQAPQHDGVLNAEGSVRVHL